jgi:hypothetical protein
MPTSASERRGAVLRWLGFTLGALFFASGLTKLLGFAAWDRLFQAFGLPAWSVYLVGAIELESGVLAFMAPTRPYGAMGIAVVAAGATLARAFTGVALPLMLLDALLFTAAVWIVREQRPAFLSPREVEEHPHGA